MTNTVEEKAIERYRLDMSFHSRRWKLFALILNSTFLAQMFIDLIDTARDHVQVVDRRSSTILWMREGLSVRGDDLPRLAQSIQNDLETMSVVEFEALITPRLSPAKR